MVLVNERKGKQVVRATRVRVANLSSPLYMYTVRQDCKKDGVTRYSTFGEREESEGTGHSYTFS